MKICKNCKKTFNDEAVFCTECGEKLVDYCKCPRCGAEIEPNSHFCSQCGYDLKQGNKCPKCGTELKPGSKFCPSCGEQLKKNQIIEAKNKSSYTQSGKTTTRILLNYILIGLFFLVNLISFVGFFGDIVTGKVLGEKTSQTIAYFFGDGIDSLEAIKDVYSSPIYFQFSAFFFALYSLAYFGGLIGLLTNLGIGIYKAVCSFKTGSAFSRNFFLFNLLSVLPYISLTSYMFLNSTNASIAITFGWGTSLLIVSAIMSALCFAFSIIIDGDKTGKDIAIKSLVSVSLIFLVLISIFGVSKQLFLKESKVQANYGIYTIFSDSLSTFAAYSKSTNSSRYSVPDLYVLSFMSSLITIAVALPSVYFLSKAKKGFIVCGIVSIGVVLFSALLSSIFLIAEYSSSYKASTIHVGLGTGTIFTLIFSICALGSLITALCLEKRQ